MAHQVTPKVILLAETKIDTTGFQSFLNELGVSGWTTDAVSDAEKLIEASGKLCYMSFDTKLNKNLTKTGGRNNYEYLQEGILKTKHGSVTEHATCTFAFLNVSRVVTHELVRHRTGAAYSQVSGRYVRTDDLGYYLPSDIANNKVAAEQFQLAFEGMEKSIKTLEGIFGIDQMTGASSFSLKKILTSAFRRLAGNGQANHIICTYNHRALRHIVAMRTSEHAEEEIRVVGEQMFDILQPKFPALYGDAEVVEKRGFNEVTFKYDKV